MRKVKSGRFKVKWREMNGHVGTYQKSFRTRDAALRYFAGLNEGYMTTGVVGAVLVSDNGKVAKKVGYYV